MPDEPPTRLEQSLLETREGPALDGDGQDEPLTCLEHSLCYIRSSMCSGDEGPMPLWLDAKDSQTTALPGSHHTRSTPARPPSPRSETYRLTAGSGPTPVVATMFGVSLSQHCPGRRLPSSWKSHPKWAPSSVVLPIASLPSSQNSSRLTLYTLHQASDARPGLIRFCSNGT
jgi:hypothetical protein